MNSVTATCPPSRPPAPRADGIEVVRSFCERALADIQALEQTCFPATWQYADAERYYAEALCDEATVHVFLRGGGIAAGYLLARPLADLFEELAPHDPGLAPDPACCYRRHVGPLARNGVLRRSGRWAEVDRQMVLFDEDGAWIPPDFNRLPAYYHINHSCEPNVGHHPDDHWVALRDIAAGDELFMDYQLTCLAAWWRRDWCGGSPRCLRLLRGDAWRNPDFAQDNLGRFPPYFKAKVAAHHGLAVPVP